MKSKELIERTGNASYSQVQLFEMYDNYDGFAVARITLSGQLFKLFEAWTPENKKQVVRQMSARGFKLVEHEVIGEYDLALWHSSSLDPNFFGTNSAHFVSLNVGQHDPGNSAEQLAQTEPRRISIRAVARLLRAWSEKYVKIAVSSYIPERTARYYDILQKMLSDCNFEWINSDKKDYGFTLSAASDHGQPL